MLASGKFQPNRRLGRPRSIDRNRTILGRQQLALKYRHFFAVNINGATLAITVVIEIQRAHIKRQVVVSPNRRIKSLLQTVADLGADWRDQRQVERATRIIGADWAAAGNSIVYRAITVTRPYTAPTYDGVVRIRGPRERFFPRRRSSSGTAIL